MSRSAAPGGGQAKATWQAGAFSRCVQLAEWKEMFFLASSQPRMPVLSRCFEQSHREPVAFQGWAFCDL